MTGSRPRSPPRRVLTFPAGPWFEASPRRKNWTVKTPCLKCGLIHDDPTAICEGYVGFDPDETAGDSRKQAAERIRKLLATVPIESHRHGHARAAAASAGASASTDAAQLATGRATAPAAEVPEWRREVSERLESYRSRRERQRAANQSVLEFRVPPKTESLQASPKIAEAAPAVLEAPAEEPPPSSPAPGEFAVAPAAMDTATDVVSSPVPKSQNGSERLRTYQPVEEADLTDDLTADITDLASHISGDVDSAPTVVEEPAESATSETMESPAALPIAAAPAVVVADSTTLEVHADPVELAEVQPAEVAAPPAAEFTPLAAIPSIDAEYWHAVPGTEAEEAECGSVTSGFAAPAAAAEEEEAIAPVEEQSLEEPAQEQEPELARVSESRSLDSRPEELAPAPAVSEAAAGAVLTESSDPHAALFSAASEDTGEEELDDRRAALRTASRPFPGTPSERIEIRVPQPVFDFSPNDVVIQPQVELQPVADLRERRRAALLDAAFLGFTIAGFFLAFHLVGGEFAFSRAGAAVAIAAAFLIYSQYVLLFTVVGGATPGMILRGLRVVCFDGQSPVSSELAWRAFGYLLSAASGMLGFLWSAWDEHGLTWHDRISQTYITYAEPDVVPAVVTTQ